MGLEHLKEIFIFLKKNWYRPFTPIILIILGNFSLIYLYKQYKPLNNFSQREFVVIFLLSLITIPFWLWSVRLPRVKKGQIGLAVAITSESKKQHLLISKDFIRNLRELLAQTSFIYKFNVIEFPEYYSNKLFENHEDVAKYLKKSRCHFILYGNAELRNYQGKETHFLNLEGEVVHAPISIEVSHRFSKEFAEIFPKKLLLSSENDLFAFVVTSEWVYYVAKYVIGVASVLSGDINYAQSLFENLEKTIPRNASNQAIQKIRKRLPERLFDVYMTQAKFAYEDWRKKHAPEEINKVKYFLDKIKGTNIDSYNIYPTLAVYHFVASRDIASAKRELRNAKKFKNNDHIWLLSLAFLFAYEGDMKNAIANYKKALKFEYPSFTLIEIEEFILWVLQTEPDKIQLYFCLGFINYFLKNDKIVAKKDLEVFLEKSSDKNFLEERELACNYIDELNQELAGNI